MDVNKLLEKGRLRRVGDVLNYGRVKRIKIAVLRGPSGANVAYEVKCYANEKNEPFKVAR